MGFRNPLTSAAAVDTGQPAGAGIRVYQGSDDRGVFGVVESRDGIASDAPMQIVDRANLIPQGGGYTQQGRTLAIRSGSANGVPGPEFDLNTEALPAGGYGPVARLRGAAVTYVDGYVAASGAAGLPVKFATAGLFQNNWTDYDATTFDQLSYRLLPDGNVRLGGVIKNTAGVAGSATSTVGVLPALARPARRQITFARAGGTFARVDVLADGTVQWTGNNFSLSAGFDVEISVFFPGPAFT